MENKLKRIAVLTSGGDSPGMNACLRAVVRSARQFGLEVFGVKRGYRGLINNEIEELRSHSVSNILQRGGTILRSARSEDFLTEQGRIKAHKNLQLLNIQGIVAIGGDGTYRGAHVFGHEFPDVAIIGCPGTIDNDLFGTDYTIGFDTALNTAIEAIDKIRDTADSHDYLFFVEVMGRDAGFIAVEAGVASGAEGILIPETKTDIGKLIEVLDRGAKYNKSSSIVIVAEGDEEGGALEIAKKVREKFDYYKTRVSILGHLQRGGSPTSFDRVLASRMGVAAVEALMAGRKDEAVGFQRGEISFTKFEKATKNKKEVDLALLRISEILTR